MPVLPVRLVNRLKGAFAALVIILTGVLLYSSLGNGYRC